MRRPYHTQFSNEIWRSALTLRRSFVEKMDELFNDRASTRIKITMELLDTRRGDTSD